MNERLAREATPPAASEAAAPAAPSEDEYQTFVAALSASARGRAFLAEYARRHRGADTEVLLAALARIEALVSAQRAGGEPAQAAVQQPAPPSAEARLALVPPPDEPELPIPSPIAASPALTLAHDRNPPAIEAPEPQYTVIIPEVSWLDAAPQPAPPAAVPPEPARDVRESIVQPPPQQPVPVAAAAKAAAPLPPADPLAELLRLSEEERIALFT